MVIIALFPPSALRAQNPSAPDQIRSARTASNAAIARHDIPGILATLATDYQAATSSGAFLTSREEMGEAFAAGFAEFPDTRYVRTSDSIAVSVSGAFAAESGHWVGSWTTPEGPFRTGGTYLAYWRRTDGRWLIHAELYVPLF